jgi:hypothetical protein
MTWTSIHLQIIFSQRDCYFGCCTSWCIFGTHFVGNCLEKDQGDGRWLFIIMFIVTCHRQSIYVCCRYNGNNKIIYTRLHLTWWNRAFLETLIVAKCIDVTERGLMETGHWGHSLLPVVSSGLWKSVRSPCHWRSVSLPASLWPEWLEEWMEIQRSKWRGIVAAKKDFSL